MHNYNVGDKVSAMVDGVHRVGKISSLNSNGTYHIVPRFFNESNESFEITEGDIFGIAPNVPNDEW